MQGEKGRIFAAIEGKETRALLVLAVRQFRVGYPDMRPGSVKRIRDIAEAGLDNAD
jgi:hypothetical protein